MTPEQAADYDRALKYGKLRTTAETQGFVNSYLNSLDAGDYSAHESHPQYLADFLDDVNDPRAIVLRKAGRRTGDAYLYPEAENHLPIKNQWQSRGNDRLYIPTDYTEHGDHFEVQVESRQTLDGSPAKRVIASVHFPTTAVGYRYRGIGRTAELTHDEARRMADYLPEPHGQELHALLDRHFPRVTDAHV